VLVPQIDVIAFIATLAGYLVHNRNGSHGTDFHTSLFAVGTAFLHAIPCPGAQVAFCGHIPLGIPDDPAWRIGTGFDAGSAPVA